jgi:hypothetical protein
MAFPESESRDHRVIFLDTFPVSTLGKSPSNPPTLTDHCRQWVMNCVAAGRSVLIPSIAYYEALRELELRGATGQIARLRSFCLQRQHFIPMTTEHLEAAARMWAQIRLAGQPTADPQALDGDVILAAQVLSLGLSPADIIVATTNPSHIRRYAPADLWTNIPP